MIVITMLVDEPKRKKSQKLLSHCNPIDVNNEVDGKKEGLEVKSNVGKTKQLFLVNGALCRGTL